MSIFVKENFSSNNSLLKEVQGLRLIQKLINDEKIEEINTPHIYKVSKTRLEIQKINSQVFTGKSMKKLGIGLAKLHKVSFEKYGLENDNYIGLSKQSNILSDNWGEFFFEYRLLFQISLIKNSLLALEFETILNKNRVKIISFLNKYVDKPSLVHGDLWSGNVLVDKNEKVYLIDPSVYFAHREVDIAMTHIFGGFTKEFYEAYNEEYPLEQEFETRKEIYNLYHYLNHYNLFGSSYLGECKKRIKLIDEM
ncbi:fructosamine kinase [Arcobacter sp. CECT 8983]|uniref:fructosamine kinase family protein n=1 Tax=Arcobacter sp. CECT 8983 TaxID=2044508 RepID=UPI00100BCD8E|nr:fructosamine kinase family protein [Arcobacter sp. CECT 8983]RXJ90880.1 fructosamine kinase [Arcobacter sp. CECT 8983]